MANLYDVSGTIDYDTSDCKLLNELIESVNKNKIFKIKEPYYNEFDECYSSSINAIIRGTSMLYDDVLSVFDNIENNNNSLFENLQAELMLTCYDPGTDHLFSTDAVIECVVVDNKYKTNIISSNIDKVFINAETLYNRLEYNEAVDTFTNFGKYQLLDIYESQYKEYYPDLVKYINPKDIENISDILGEVCYSNIEDLLEELQNKES